MGKGGKNQKLRGMGEGVSVMDLEAEFNKK